MTFLCPRPASDYLTSFQETASAFSSVTLSILSIVFFVHGMNKDCLLQNCNIVILCPIAVSFYLSNDCDFLSSHTIVPVQPLSKDCQSLRGVEVQIKEIYM